MDEKTKKQTLCEHEQPSVQTSYDFSKEDNKPKMLESLRKAVESDKNNVHAAASLAHLAIELQEYDIATSALRTITLSKVKGPMSKAQAFSNKRN